MPGVTALNVIDLGRMAYQSALDRQRATHEQVVAGVSGPVLFLLEHEPVITVSQRQDSLQHLLADRATLARLGIDVQPTDRGGDITYHGPGQLVAYPILRLADYGLNVSRYMRLLEEVVIATVAGFGVAARREPGATGTWVPTPRGEAKLAALGVRIRRGVTMHGLALNVTTNLDHFKTIIPCGLVGRPVTSMRELLGPVTPTMDAVKAALVAQFMQKLSELS